MWQLHKSRGRVRSLWLVAGLLGLAGWIPLSHVATRAESQSTKEAQTAVAAPAAPAAPARPAGLPHRTLVSDWLAAGLGRNHPAFKELERGYLPPNVGIARRASSGTIDARAQRVLFEERRLRIASVGRRPSDAEVREQRSREDASIKQLNQAFIRSRDRLRRLHDANDLEGMLALERELLEQHTRPEPPAEGQ
jgi:hypothetical protein